MRITPLKLAATRRTSDLLQETEPPPYRSVARRSDVHPFSESPLCRSTRYASHGPQVQHADSVKVSKSSHSKGEALRVRCPDVDDPLSRHRFPPYSLADTSSHVRIPRPHTSPAQPKELLIVLLWSVGSGSSPSLLFDATIRLS